MARAKAKAKTTELSVEEAAALEALAFDSEKVEPSVLAVQAEAAGKKNKAYSKQRAEKPSKPIATSKASEAPAAPKETSHRRKLSGDNPVERIRSAFTESDALMQATVLTKAEKPTESNANKVLELIGGITAKKVAEKAVNLIVNRHRPQSVSVFTRLAIQHLLAKGSATSGELITLFRDCKENNGNGYGEGTARSQGSQMMILLDTLSVAVREGKTLRLNKDSTIAAEFQAAA